MKELDGEINRENKGEAEDGWLARVISPVNCPLVPCYCKPSNWRLVSQRLAFFGVIGVWSQLTEHLQTGLFTDEQVL